MIGINAFVGVSRPVVFPVRKVGGERGVERVGGFEAGSDNRRRGGLDERSRAQLLRDLRDEAERKAREIEEAEEYERWDGLA